MPGGRAHRKYRELQSQRATRAAKYTAGALIGGGLLGLAGYYANNYRVRTDVNRLRLQGLDNYYI